MAEKSLGYVELEWRCPSCGNRNPGSRKTCAKCGAPQGADVQFEQAAQEQIITDQEKIAQAAAGPDIHCAYCGARNPATAKTCKQCGADLTEGTARAAGRVLGAHRDKPAPPLICPACGTSNPATALNCSKCGSSLAQPKPAPPPRAEAPRPFLGKGCLAILLGLIAVAVIIIFLATRTTGMVGEVSDVNWKRTISIEALVPVTKETWRDQVPEGAPIGECREKAHHIQDEPAPGAEEICGTPYTVDQGSGFGKVVQDCRYQVYADWCQYQTTEWRSVNAVVAEGRDLNPYWPELTLVKDQRQGARQEEYVVTFMANDKEYRYTISNPSEFERFAVGSHWQLEVNTFGAITRVEPAG